MTTATRGHTIEFDANALICECGARIECAGLTLSQALALVKLHNQVPRGGLVPNRIHANWGSLLRNARKQKGLKQTDLAPLAGVSQPTVSHWECGGHNPNPFHRSVLAEILDTTEDELFPEAAS